MNRGCGKGWLKKGFWIIWRKKALVCNWKEFYATLHFKEMNDKVWLVRMSFISCMMFETFPITYFHLSPAFSAPFSFLPLSSSSLLPISFLLHLLFLLLLLPVTPPTLPPFLSLSFFLTLSLSSFSFIFSMCCRFYMRID